MSENAVMKKIQVALSNEGSRVFRNNVGLFETKDKRKVHTGLCVGSSDLIGWTPMTITPEMVGTRVAVFTAIEVKSEKGKLRQEQWMFLKAVANFGGIAVMARSVDEAVGKLKGILLKYGNGLKE